MLKNKKPLIAFGLSLLIGLVGGTIAYYSNSTNYTNEFQTAKYKTTTIENFVSPDNWQAGEEINKSIITKNEGTVPVAVRASYTEKWYDTDNKEITVDDSVTLSLNNGSWVKEGNYYYYRYIVEPNETTKSFMNSVLLNKEVGVVTCTTSGNQEVCESVDEATGKKYVLTVTIETISYNKYKEVWNTNIDVVAYTSPITYVTRQNEGQITTGDLIKVGTEEFYVVSSDEDTTVLLAHYNLNVGDNKNSSVIEGIQNETIKGWLKSGTKYGNVVFALTGYWEGKVGLTDEYLYQGEYSYTTLNWPYVYDSNSNLYAYIENYKIILENNRLDVQKGRLLTYQEAIKLGCPTSIGVCTGNSWVYETSYWLGNSRTASYVWRISSDNNFSNSVMNSADFGVRPVIEISTADLK